MQGSGPSDAGNGRSALPTGGLALDEGSHQPGPLRRRSAPVAAGDPHQAQHRMHNQGRCPAPPVSPAVTRLTQE